MKSLKILLTTFLVSVGVAVVYFYFELVVRISINFVWDDLFSTEVTRILVIPLCIVLSLIFFGAQHYFDPQSEQEESVGLGDAPIPTFINFIKVICIGFLSLLAGASLGPEAILVPASMIVGGYIGMQLFKGDFKTIKLMTMVGFVALFAAFFHSFIAGILGLLLVLKKLKLKPNLTLLLLAAIASFVTVWILSLLSGSPYMGLPESSWAIGLSTCVVMIILLAAGYAVTFLIKFAHTQSGKIFISSSKYSWWAKALFASAGLSVLYLLGGPLVEFTGNESVLPMLQQASSLGLFGLLWLAIIKIAAIGWSKAVFYRGGMVFPTIFIASVLVAISQIFVTDMNFTYGLIAVMAGVIIANQKAKFLF